MGLRCGTITKMLQAAGHTFQTIIIHILTIIVVTFFAQSQRQGQSLKSGVIRAIGGEATGKGAIGCLLTLIFKIQQSRQYCEQPRRHPDAYPQITQTQMVKKGTHGYVDQACRAIETRGHTINAAVDEKGSYGTRRLR